jgi:hypothetical protein
MSVGLSAHAPQTMPQIPPSMLAPPMGATPMAPAAPVSSGPPTLNLSAPSASGMPTVPQAPQMPGAHNMPQLPMGGMPSFAPSAGAMPTSNGGMPMGMPQAPAAPQFAPQVPSVPLAGASAANFPSPWLVAPQAQVPGMPQMGAWPQQPVPQVPAQPQMFAPAPQAPAAPFAPQQPASTVLRDSMIRQGYSVQAYTSDADLLADIGQIVQRGQDAQTQLQILQSQQSHGPQQQGGQQPGGAQPQQPGQGGAPQSPAKPQWDPQWDSLVRRDPATGLYVTVNPYVHPDVAQRANQYDAWKRQRANAIVENPMDVIGPELRAELSKFGEDIRKQVVGELATAQRNAATEAQIDAFMAKNAATFVVVGQDGRPATGLDGRQMLTPRGQAFYEHVTNYKQQFASIYGREPDRLDTLRHVSQALAQDEQAGRFGAPQQPGLPQMQPQLPATPQMFAQPGMPQMAAFPQMQVPGFAPQQPQLPALAPLGGASAAGFNPWMARPQMAMPQQPGYAPQYVADPQSAMVARAMANNAAMYQPQANGTLVNNMLHPQVPQQPSTDLRGLFMQAAQARGMSTDGFHS